MLLNRKGIVGTCVSGQMLFIGPTLTRVKSSAPILTWSTVLLGAQRLLLKTLILYLPPLFLLEQLAHRLDGRRRSG